MNYVINQIKKYIEAHFNEPITLDNIAKVGGYSKYHLNRLFYEDTGQTIYQYIKERRLFEAANLLNTTQQSIVEIALEVGYTSQQSFTLAFKQRFLCTPFIYRKQKNYINNKPLPLLYIENKKQITQVIWYQMEEIAA